MLLKISITLLMSLLILTFAWRFGPRSRRSGTELPSSVLSSAGPCQANRYIQKLSSDTPEAGQAAMRLTELAKESSTCREEVINGLIEALNKADLQNFDPDFRLWAKGSGILGELKAVEALDLLIDHLDLNDGLFSASMIHQPVVPAVEEMGEVAVPKLGFALKHHQNRDVRLAAALCLADISGAEAVHELNSALVSETDQCVRRFITLSLQPPPARPNSKRPLTAEDGKPFMQRLLAFTCN